MDDATRLHLLRKGIKPLGTPYVVDESKILELTQQLLKTKMTGSLQTAFDDYVTECMHHLIAREYDDAFKPVSNQRTAHDQLLLPVCKNLDFFVKRKKYKLNLK
jgi:hypothetical protein